MDSVGRLVIGHQDLAWQALLAKVRPAYRGQVQRELILGKRVVVREVLVVGAFVIGVARRGSILCLIRVPKVAFQELLPLDDLSQLVLVHTMLLLLIESARLACDVDVAQATRVNQHDFLVAALTREDLLTAWVLI